MTEPKPEPRRLTPQEEDLVRQGIELLKSLEGKPPVPPEMAAKMGNGPWTAAPPPDPDAEKPLF